MAVTIGPGWTVGPGWTLGSSGSPVIVTPNPTSASPTSGTNAGGTPVTLTGTGFTGVTSMSIDYPGFVVNTVTSFTVDSDTQISFTSPVNAYVPGSGYVIKVTNTAGTGTLSGWTYT